MARLERGENSKIDMINDLVVDALSDNADVSKDSLNRLLELFHPLILKLCKKWSIYFNDENHNIKPFDELVSDAQYWFIRYTTSNYTIGGAATYNKFIKDHIDQRIRYIFECEIKYRSKNIFPDPYDDNNDCDVFDDVVNKYVDGGIQNNVEDDIIGKYVSDSKSKLTQYIIKTLHEILNDREYDIFMQIVYNGATHDDMGKKYNISRTRATQILAKSKSKLYKHMEDDDMIWQLLDDADIDITNPKIN